jgi:hypothetical protein
MLPAVSNVSGAESDVEMCVRGWSWGLQPVCPIEFRLLGDGYLAELFMTSRMLINVDRSIFFRGGLKSS